MVSSHLGWFTLEVTHVVGGRNGSHMSNGSALRPATGGSAVT